MMHAPATHRTRKSSAAGPVACLGVAVCAAFFAQGCATVASAPPSAFPASFESMPADGAPVADLGWSGADGDDASGEITLSGDPSRTPKPLAAKSADEWVITATPYLWMLGIDGKVTAKGQKADLNMSFSDILDDLSYAAMMHVEAWNGDWGFVIDPLYAALSASDHIGPDELDSKLRLTIVDALVMRHLATSDDGDTQLDGLAGLRYWNLNASAAVDSLGIHRSDSTDWVDALIGARVITKLDKDWTFSLRGDVGGFGIGSSAKKEWSATTGFAYEVDPTNHVFFGYKLLSIDKSTGSGANETGLNAQLTGPAVGWEFAF